MEPVIFFAAVAVVGVIGVRLARMKGLVRSAKRCDACGRSEPSTTVRFFKNTGMIIMFRSESAGGQLCRSCGLDVGLRMTMWTLALGWWGMISFFVNILFVANNFGNLLWALTLPSGAAIAVRALDEHREYALNLLATKDFDDVVYVLRQTSGASTEAVKAYLESLRASPR
jgi:hypothetical protein